MTETSPAPAAAAGPERQYFEALAQGRLQLQHCTQCGTHLHYPRVACTACGSQALEWVSTQGAGVVYAVTTVRLDPAKPYNVSIIELDEGVRLMSTVGGSPDAVKIGQRVSARVERRGDAQARVVFDLAEPQTGAGA